MEGQEGLGHVPRPRNFAIANAVRIGRFPCDAKTFASHPLHPQGVSHSSLAMLSKTKYHHRRTVFYFGGPGGT